MDTSSLDFIKGRRTVRKFTGESITDEHADFWMPRLRPHPHWTSSPGISWRCATKVHRWPMPCVSILSGECRWVVARGEPDRSPTWMMDGSAAIENLLLAAHVMGLGGAWAGGPGGFGFEAAESLLRKEMDAPADVRLVSLVALGVPAETPPPHGKERWNRFRIHRGKFSDLWE